MHGCYGTENGVYLWTAGKRTKKGYKSFYWAYGSKKFPMKYTNWHKHPSEPDNHGKDEGCVNIWPKFGNKWNDEACDLKSCFVCAK